MPTDPFSTLGLPARFDLSEPEIRRAFLTRMAQSHPDAASGGAGDAGEDAAAAGLTGAKRTLENPESRAEALLAHLGGPGKSENRSLPAGFLVEIMNVREQVEEAAGDPARLAEWRGWAAQKRTEYVAGTGAAFAGLSSPPARVDLEKIRTTLNAWRYIERLIEQLDPAAGRSARGEGGA